MGWEKSTEREIRDSNATWPSSCSHRKWPPTKAKAIAALNHPTIVAIYDTGEHNGLLYLVTELVDGESLGGASLTLRKTLDLAVQISDGLAAAHAAGITHRDLKPDNSMVTRAGRVSSVIVTPEP